MIINWSRLLLADSFLSPTSAFKVLQQAIVASVWCCIKLLLTDKQKLNRKHQHSSASISYMAVTTTDMPLKEDPTQTDRQTAV